MPCIAKKTFEIAAATGNHLLVQVKNNQAWLLDRVQRLTKTATRAGRHDSRDYGRSRQDERTVETFALGEALAGSGWHPFLRTAIRVTRRRLKRNPKSGLWHSSEEVAYYVSSAKGLSAERCGVAIRHHWGIENRDHYVRDVSLAEDASRIRTNPGIMARTRSMALNLLRANGVQNVALALWENALRLDRVLRYRGL